MKKSKPRHWNLQSPLVGRRSCDFGNGTGWRDKSRSYFTTCGAAKSVGDKRKYRNDFRRLNMNRQMLAYVLFLIAPGLETRTPQKEHQWQNVQRAGTSRESTRCRTICWSSSSRACQQLGWSPSSTHLKCGPSNLPQRSAVLVASRSPALRESISPLRLLQHAVLQCLSALRLWVRSHAWVFVWRRPILPWKWSSSLSRRWTRWSWGLCTPIALDIP